jgi:hypothetical protein
MKRRDMRKFNPGFPPQIVAVSVRRLTRRRLDRAIKKFARFFNVDNDLEQVSRFAEYYGYTLGTTENFVFIVLDGSEFNDIAIENPEILELAIHSEKDLEAVAIL